MSFIGGMSGRGLSAKSAGLATLATLCALTAVSPARAVVVMFDGFGDADLNNNNVALEPYDGDINNSAKGTTGNSWEPVQFSADPDGNPDTIFADGVLVQEITTVENSLQRGVPWYFASGYTTTGDPPHDPKVNARIINDATAYLPDTNPAIGFTSRNPGPALTEHVTVDAINNGYALAVESKGRNSALTAFFDEKYSGGDGNQGRLTLGPAVGDKVKVSFDFRVWMSAPNYNSSSKTHVPTESEIRFGLYQDTDNQLGTINSAAGDGGGNKVWGEEGGLLRGGGPVSVGGDNDRGWFARVQIEDPDEADTTFRPPANGGGARIVEERNDSTTSASNRAIMSGSDNDTIAAADSVSNPVVFVNMNYRKVYNLSLTLERIDDPVAGSPVGGDNVRGTLTVIDRLTQQNWTLTGFDTLGAAATNDTDGGFESDAWDYFAMTTDGGVDEIDWIMDNFKVEIFGSNAPAERNADFNSDGKVDGADFLTWQANFGRTGLVDKSLGNANPDVAVSSQDLAEWAAKFGGPPATAAGTPAPEPGGAALAAVGALGALGWRRRRGR